MDFSYLLVGLFDPLSSGSRRRRTWRTVFRVVQDRQQQQGVCCLVVPRPDEGTPGSFLGREDREREGESILLCYGIPT